MTFVYKMSIRYDGTHYSGWQMQKNGLSIQQVMEESLATILRYPVAVAASGRTDAGVHALAQIAHFKSDQNLDVKKLLLSLNGVLPSDIRVTSLQLAPEGFHARFSAISKTYHYHIRLGPIHDPFNQLYSYQVSAPLDIALMREASKHFLGTHDFTSFANNCREGSAKNSPIKTIFRCDLIEDAQNLRIECHGTGFLYKMVRNMVGTLLDIGMGKSSSDVIPFMLSLKDRAFAGRSAPAKGLFLVHVEYKDSSC